MNWIMIKYALNKKQARQFILLKQGLIGDYKFHGKEGIMQFVRQAGCVQYDPIDVCGKNAELTLQSRVDGFTKQMLYDLLYQDRCLIDYFDKNLAIIDVRDWKFFERIREAHKQQGRGHAEVNQVADKIKAIIAEKGPVCSKDLEFDEKVNWYWSDTKLSRAALETLYFRGELIIHHKKGTIKYYALTEDYIPKEITAANDPFKNQLEHMKWSVLRRISAVGLLWNKPSDAWLCISNMKSKERNQVIQELLAEEKIIEIEVEDSKAKYYCVENDRWIIDQVRKEPKLKKRTELIAPLDSFLWDRKLIKELFDFDYKWEIYTPFQQRKYGYYVLPILSGERFVGRTEVICDRKTSILIIKNIWFEADVKVTKKLCKDIKLCYEHFKRFHSLEEIIYTEATSFIHA